MKIFIYSLFCFVLLVSCGTEHVLLDSHKGTVVDKSSKKTITGVEIYTDSIAFDSFTPILTKEDGYFITSGLVIPHDDKGYAWRRNMSYTLIFRAPGYISDTIDLRSIPKESNQTLDTIDLGIIYLTPLEEN